MPFRKNYRRKRRGRRGRRRRYGPHKYRVSKWGRNKYNIHKFRRMGGTSEVALLDLTGVGEKGTAFNFNVSDIVNNTELTRLYDQYRIDFVTVTLNWSPKMPNQETFYVGPNSMVFPVCYYAKDYDDYNTPLSLASMKERGNLRTFRLTPFKKFKINVKPAVQNAVIRDATTTPPLIATNPSWNKKLDCASPSIPHIGLKLLFDFAPGVNMGSVNIETTYHVTMFGTR